MKRYQRLLLSKAAESAHRRPLPRWAIRVSYDCGCGKNHSRVIKEIVKTTATDFSDAALI